MGKASDDRIGLFCDRVWRICRARSPEGAALEVVIVFVRMLVGLLACPGWPSLFLSVKSESLAHKVSPTDKLVLEVLNIPPLWRGPFYGSELMLIPDGQSKQQLHK